MDLMYSPAQPLGWVTLSTSSHQYLLFIYKMKRFGPKYLLPLMFFKTKRHSLRLLPLVSPRRKYWDTKNQTKNSKNSFSFQDKGVQCQASRTGIFNVRSYFFLDLTVASADTFNFPVLRPLSHGALLPGRHLRR